MLTLKPLPLLAASLAALSLSNATAQTYPSRPITLIAPYAAGGDSDLSARNLAPAVSKVLGQPVVVQNVVGAAGMIGSKRVRDAAPDGYTLLLGRTGSQGINPALDAKGTPYKWNDFTFLTVVELNPLVCVVRADSPYKTAKDLTEAIRAKPGTFNYASSGAGTIQHITSSVFLNSAGLPNSAAQNITYKGGSEVTTALLSNQVQFICNNMTSLVGQIKGGAMRPLVTTSRQRLRELPEAPTADEAGMPQLGLLNGWSVLYGPPGMPADVVAKWVDAIKKAAADPDWQKGNAAIGGIAMMVSPAETEKFVKEQIEMFEQVGAKLGLKLNP